MARGLAEDTDLATEQRQVTVTATAQALKTDGVADQVNR